MCKYWILIFTIVKKSKKKNIIRIEYPAYEESLKSDSHLPKIFVLFASLWQTSRFLTSQPGLQKIAIQIFPNISQNKGNQTIKFGQLIEYNKRNIFLQKLWKNEARRLVPDLFSFFKKNLNMRWKQVVWSLVSIYFHSPQVAI